MCFYCSNIIFLCIYLYVKRDMMYGMSLNSTDINIVGNAIEREFECTKAYYLFI